MESHPHDVTITSESPNYSRPEITYINGELLMLTVNGEHAVSISRCLLLTVRCFSPLAGFDACYCCWENKN